MKSRVSVDIDSHVPNVEIRVLRAYHGLYDHGATDVKVAVSSSGTGFHVVGHFDTRLAQETKFEIRENLNDDPNRLRMDRQRAERGLPTQTMWDEKGGNDGTRQVFDTADDALRHVELTRGTAHEHAKRIQNHGRKAIRDERVPHTKAIASS